MELTSMNKTLSYYENNAKDLSKRYESAKLDNIHALLLDTFPPKTYLLEIGSGSGRDASYMFGHGYDVLATDGSKEMITEAKSTHPELDDNFKVIQLPSDLLKFKNNSFDGVYSIATLMHLSKEEIAQSIESVAKILKNGGRFLFSVSIERDDIDEAGKDNKGRHFTVMSEHEWVKLCEKYGFTLKQSVVNDDGLDRDGIVWLTCVMEKIIE